MCFWFAGMEDNIALDRKFNHRQPSLDVITTFYGLIYVAQGYQVVTSEPDDATGTTYVSIYRPFFYSPLPEKYPQFLGGELSHSPIDWSDTDQSALKETYYLDLTLCPLVSIEMNRELFQSPIIPEVGIPPVTSNKKLKFKGYDYNNDSQCGYDSDN